MSLKAIAARALGATDKASRKPMVSESDVPPRGLDRSLIGDAAAMAFSVDMHGDVPLKLRHLLR